MEENNRIGRPKGRNIVHGTNSGYNYGCKCEACKKAHADRNRESNRVNAYKYAEKRKEYQAKNRGKNPSERKILKKSIESEPVYRFVGARARGRR